MEASNPVFSRAEQYQVGDLIFTGCDTVRTKDVCILDKLIITLQRIHSLIFHGQFYSKAARNTHVAIVVEVDRNTNSVWIAEAVPTKKHKNDLRHVDMIHHNYYKLDANSVETFEVLRPANEEIKKFAENAAAKAREVSTRVDVKKKNVEAEAAPAASPAEAVARKPKHKFSHVIGMLALLAKEKKGGTLRPEEFELTKTRNFFCSYFVSLMLRNGEFDDTTKHNGTITRMKDGQAETVSVKSNPKFDFNPKTNSPQKLREYLENNTLFTQVGVVNWTSYQAQV